MDGDDDGKWNRKWNGTERRGERCLHHHHRDRLHIEKMSILAHKPKE